jgi:hypothetical protein
MVISGHLNARRKGARLVGSSSGRLSIAGCHCVLNGRFRTAISLKPLKSDRLLLAVAPGPQLEKRCDRAQLIAITELNIRWQEWTNGAIRQHFQRNAGRDDREPCSM